MEKEGYLVRSRLAGAGRMRPFTVEQIFLPMGEVRPTPKAGTRGTARGGDRRPKGRENFLGLNVSCPAMKPEFYFT